MEERMMEKDDERKIKIKKNAVGGVENATEDGVEEELFDEEVLFAIPEGEDYDEDLVGLTPSQLKKAMQERERARQEAIVERDQLVAQANIELAEGDFEGAEESFSLALVYDRDCVEAQTGVWKAISQNFALPEALLTEENAQRVAASSAECKQYVRAQVGERFAKLKEEYEGEAIPLLEKYETAQAERAEAFAQNKSYYLWRFFVVLGVFLLFGAAIAVSAGFLVKVRDITLPLAFTIGFGGVTFLNFILLSVYGRKLFVASKLVSQNKRLGSTEDGQRLAYLQDKIECLKLILDDEEIA